MTFSREAWNQAVTGKKLGGIAAWLQGRYLRDAPYLLWPPNRIVRERIRLSLERHIVTPTVGRAYIEMEGHSQPVEIGTIKIVPRTWMRPSKNLLARFGDGIALSEAALELTMVSQGSVVPLHLRWQVSAAPGRDLITFVHLGDPTQPPLLQADGPALGGDYPSRFWAAGEVFDDRYALHLPAEIPTARYPVYVGLHDPHTGERVPVRVNDEQQPYNALLVGWLDVE